MLELVLVLPLFFVLVFVSLEINRAYRAKQATQTLSRLVGDLAFRQCAIEEGIDAEACLYDVVLSRALGQSTALAPDVGVIVSIYRKPTAASPVTLEAIACPERNISTCRTKSRFAVGVISSTPEYRRVLNGHKVAVISEIYFPHSTLFLPQAVAGLSDGFYYDAYII